MSDSEDDEFVVCEEDIPSDTETRMKMNGSVVRSGELIEDHQNGNGCDGDEKHKDQKCNGSRSPVNSTNQQLSEWGARTTLPSTMFSRNDFSVWSILKHCIGAELSKITMPVIFNEPLSFLQRIVEYMEYLNLLKRASESDDPIERHELITAFAVSAAASNWERIGKPFNPLLCETFELERKDLGFKVVCEQVSHHPPVSAFHVESDLYTFSGSIYPKLKFWGKSVEVTPKGLVTLYLKKHKEAYSWQNVNCCVHNVIVGKLWIEHYGAMEVTNHMTKYKSVLNFLPCGWFGKDLHKIEGFLYDNNKKKIRAFYGKWVDSFFSYGVDVFEEYVKAVAMQAGSSTKSGGSGSSKNKANGTEGSVSSGRGSSTKHLPKTHSEPAMSYSSGGGGDEGPGPDQVPDQIPVRSSQCDLNIPTQKLLWVAAPKPSNSSLYYSFTSFALMLNQLDDDMLARLPPTDCRLRPDMRKMEEGQIDLASEEKNRIEELQRAGRKERKKRKDELVPLWFRLGTNPYTNKEDWLTTGEYWRRDWTRCPVIY